MIDKIKEIRVLLEKARQYNETLYNLIGDLVAGRDATEIRRQIFISNRLYDKTIVKIDEVLIDLENS